jgi:uncharacterized membrane protein
VKKKEKEKMRARTFDGLALSAIVTATLVSGLVYDRLPDPVPTHFDLNGNPNGWMPRTLAALFIPVLGLVLWVFTRFVVKILPRSEKRRLDDTSLAMVASLTAVFISAVHILVMYVAVVPHVNITQPVFVLMGFFYVALGLILPRIRRNPLIGVRTPWTLTSDENWARTQRFAGYAMVVGGIIGGLAGIAGGIGGIVALAAFLLAGVVPAGYSLLIARRADS